MYVVCVATRDLREAHDRVRAAAQEHVMAYQRDARELAGAEVAVEAAATERVLQSVVGNQAELQHVVERATTQIGERRLLLARQQCACLALHRVHARHLPARVSLPAAGAVVAAGAFTAGRISSGTRSSS